MSEFGILDLSEIQEEDSRVNAEQTPSFLDNFVAMPKPKPGQSAILTVRILPPLKGKRLFQYTRVHNINGRKVHDPKRLDHGKWDKTPNPIVDYYNSLWKEADKAESNGRSNDADALKAEARSIKPIERYYYNVIVRKMTDSEGNTLTNVGPKILSIGKTVHKMIVRAIVGDETEPALGDITHPSTGYDFHIKIEMRGTGNEAYPNYDRSAFARDPSPLGTPEEVKVWIENMHDLESLHHVVPYDQLEKELAIHRGLIEDTESDQFNTANFDAKFKASNTPSTTPTASVASTTTRTTTPVVEENYDEVVSDVDFLKKMQEMQEEVE